MAASRTSKQLAIALALLAAILLPVSLYVRHQRQRVVTAPPAAPARDPWANPDEPLPPRYAPRDPAVPPTPPPAPPPDDPDANGSDDTVLPDPFASRQPANPGAGCGADCVCEDGTQTHTVQIVNGQCVDDAIACTRACESHDGVKGTWDPSRGKRTGEACTYAAQCAQKICNHGLCSRTCKTFGDCPSGWDCDSPRFGLEGECRKR